ncbi:DUF4112 domain-containing protein [Asticcacaulis currens]|jgi:hypothetical protein|uniref:DUF4112 domain-containing protein n=1 Tax=Asticcacaulis currens TaxID=2984210 RepID=A0ABT5IBI8_9CAUL|nr:DUF4112 domain-containing protein [Asticcacaulis currens]MDC7693542.1 DUF4112 domain-containing protein [Asticcacaulis currens]
MFVRSAYEVQKTYDSIGTIKRLSDRIVGIGPINIIGLDGLLSWVPVPGVAAGYSIIASLFILINAVRVRISPITFVQTLIVLSIDAGISGFDGIIPLLPVSGLADTLFQGHLYAAHIVQKEIEKTLYIEESGREAYASGRHKDHLATLKSTRGKKRLVYLLP